MKSQIKLEKELEEAVTGMIEEGKELVRSATFFGETIARVEAARETLLVADKEHEQKLAGGAGPRKQRKPDTVVGRGEAEGE